jgi:hypothetical protein
MGLWHKLFGYPPPDGLVGCYYCGRRTDASLGLNGPRHRLECSWCNAGFGKIATCPECGWQKGVQDALLYVFPCDCCGEQICSVAFKLLETEELRRQGYYVRD